MAGGASQKSLASSTMILTGLAILIFVPIHVWQFKFRTHYELSGGITRSLSDRSRELQLVH